MENNTRISESGYSSLEELPERAQTDSFNIVTQKSVKHFRMSSDETANKLLIRWGETTEAEAMEVEAEVKVNPMAAEKILT